MFVNLKAQSQKMRYIATQKGYISIGTCEASRFDSNSNRTSRFEFDSKVTCRSKILESAAHAAVCRYTTNYTHSLFNKNINLCAVCS